jgi:Flp pilus assembly protein TadD
MRQPPRLRRSMIAAVSTVVVLFGFAVDTTAQPGRVGGLVKDEKGEPIKGATITAENENIGSSFTATTDDKGRFTIIGLRAGVWRFIAQAPGFAAEGGQMPVKSGTPNPPMTFALKRTGAAWSGAMAGITAKDIQNELSAADALFTQQKFDEAIAAYRQIMSRSPALSVINLQIAAAYRGKKDYDGALNAYKALLAIDPNNEKASVGISQMSLERGDVKAAEDTLMKAAESSSAGRDVFFNLAEVKSSQSAMEDAVKWYEKASAADPSWGKPLYKLGLLAMNKGDKQNAAKLFDRVIAVDPVSPEAALAKTSLDQLNKP